MADRLHVSLPIEARIDEDFVLLDVPADGRSIKLALPVPVAIVSHERLGDALAAWRARRD